MEKKKVLLGLLLLIAFLSVIGISYAVWQLTHTQNGTNSITSSCFKVKFQDENPIELEKSYPVLDEEGKKLLPYTFTLTNQCSTYASYQINLEILNSTTLEDLNFIKIMLDDSVSLLTDNSPTTKTLEEAKESYKLKTGYLKPNESKSYTFRMWVSEDTPTESLYMNKLLFSKITVITSYVPDADQESPIASFTTSRTENGILVDASTSTDNKEIVNYYYSTDGVNWNSSKESNYTFSEGNLEYGIGTNLLNKLASTRINTVFVKVEDEFGNQSDVVKKTIGEFAYDDTKDNNLRYIGKNPNNYVNFNGEKWRIIGVMNNMKTNDSDAGESRLKLIRAESIGSYSWDTTPTGTNGGDGYNDWAHADAMKLLNEGYENESVGGSLYWNAGSGTCYNGSFNTTTSCNFTSTGLKDDKSKNMIVETIWNLGGTSSYISAKDGLANHWYGYERGTTVYNGRPTTWKGKIALMYQSDYGYATSGGSTTDRKSCLQKELYNWNNSSVSDCKNNDWLYHSTLYQWTLSPYASCLDHVFSVYQDGSVNYNYAYSAYGLVPTLYLNANVKIVSGDGSLENSFNLEL